MPISKYKANQMLKIYHDRINTEKTWPTQEILSNYNTKVQTAVERTTLLHHYLYNEIKYIPKPIRTSNPKTPVQTLERKGGNCEEQSILLASLLSQITGVQARILSIQNPEEYNHVLLETHFPHSSPEDVVDTVKEIYAEHDRLQETPDALYAEQDSEQRTWFITDPEQSHWLGDMNSLFNSDWAHKTENSWQWNKMRFRGPPLY